MPAGDGTGPMGMGSMTGRAGGFCAGYGMPGYMNPVPGRGFGMGFGRGRGFGGRGGGRGSWAGWRNMFYATGLPGWSGVPSIEAPGSDAEKQFLEAQAKAMKEQLDEINQRLVSLDAEIKKE